MQEMQERPCGATAKPLCKAASAPSYRSYMSYWSYRGVLWHVADVPGVQGKVEVWKLGCLEVWLSRCTTISPVARLSGVLFSVLCSPFSRARKRPSPAGVWGSAPHLFQSISQSAKILF